MFNTLIYIGFFNEKSEKSEFAKFRWLPAQQVFLNLLEFHMVILNTFLSAFDSFRNLARARAGRFKSA